MWALPGDPTLEPAPCSLKVLAKASCIFCCELDAERCHTTTGAEWKTCIEPCDYPHVAHALNHAGGIADSGADFIFLVRNDVRSFNHQFLHALDGYEIYPWPPHIFYALQRYALG
jgi:hypothetical protein